MKTLMFALALCFSSAAFGQESATAPPSAEDILKQLQAVQLQQAADLADLKQVKADLQVAQEEVAGLQVENKNLKDAVSVLTERTVALEALVPELKKKAADLQVVADTAKAKATDLETRLSHANGTVYSLEQQVASANGAVHQMRSQVNGMRGQVAAANWHARHPLASFARNLFGN